MATLLSIDEVFAIAIQMEANGAAFYRDVAAKYAEPAVSEFVLRFAAMEEEHRKTFTKMRGELAGGGNPPADMAPEGGLYLAAIADGYRVEGSPRVAASITGKEPLADVLRTAMWLERDAVLFYLGIRELIRDASDRDCIDRIVAEEKKHIVAIAQEIRKLARA